MSKALLTSIRRALALQFFLVSLVIVCSTSSFAQEIKPYVKSVEVLGAPGSNARSIQFKVLFNEDVTGVDIEDFKIEVSKEILGASIDGLKGSGPEYIITVIDIPEFADGFVSIDLKGNGTGIANSKGEGVAAFTDGLYHYVGAAFDVSRAVYAGDPETFSFTNEEQHAFSLEFTPDGFKMFVMGFYQKRIFEYHLDKAFDVSTATYAGDGETFHVFPYEVNPRSIAFNTQGDKMFMLGSQKDLVFEFILSSPYDVSSAVFSGDRRTFNVKPQGNFPYSMSFNNEGTKLFVAEMRSASIYEYYLSKPFDVSTVSYAGDAEKFSIDIQDRSAVSLKFNLDGSRMFVLGNEGKDINEYTLETAFDVSTARYSGDVERLSIADHDGDPRSITFNSDGTKMFVLGNGKDRILEYNLDAMPLTLQESSLWKVVSDNPTEPLVKVAAETSGSIKLGMNESSLVFEFSTNSTNQSDHIQYQTLLEGAEEFWSGWSTSDRKQFDRLPHGNYSFKVKARNRYGEESPVGILTFSIRTPWYFTIWAYIFYGLLLVVLIWRIVKFNTYRLEKEKKALELIVQERTAEIATRMTEVESANVLIKEQADRLEELDKVKSRFFANISHELRTPLTLINAPLESLIENGRIEDEEVLETLGVVRRNGGSLLSLVEEILDLTKLEAGKLALIENPVRLSEFIDDLAAPYKEGMKSKTIDFKVDFQPDTELTIQLDTNHAAKILNNLLSNAMKFTSAGGSITLKVEQPAKRNDWLSVSVKDNGKGIHSHDIPHVFDRFYQAEKGDKKASGGTGIGLALAKELAQLFKGTLEVESTIGKGSEFTFEFPFKRVDEEVVLPLSTSENDQLDKALRTTVEAYSHKFEVGKPVLLVTEDHPEMRAFIAQTLQPYFEIKQAENGQMALDILKKERVDIVISDVMMPVMDGFELLEAIKQDESLHEVSLIMLTARAEQEDKLFALTIGIDDYLTKPFNASEFLARIKNILENRIKILRELKGLGGDDLVPYTADMVALMKTYDLSEREVDVIRLMTKRYTNPEIAEALHISKNTVKFHTRNIYSKLDIKGRTEISDKIASFAS